MIIRHTQSLHKINTCITNIAFHSQKCEHDHIFIKANDCFYIEFIINSVHLLN